MPASVTLAQAHIESEDGKSSLAKDGNNYFGIKAYANPRNFPIVYHSDDLPNEPFRSYKTVAESFADHAYFLKVEQPRYASLFDSHDYNSWADGLHEAGYATAPGYAESIKNTINEYGLAKYDKWGANKMIIIFILLLIFIFLVVFALRKFRVIK